MKLAERALLAEPFHAMAFGQRAAELEAAGPGDQTQSG